ncbi:hypothetical protein A4S05_11455 [Nostoc sp. KVJ20]|nr:hypothetical protein A4S05_11455 [Nostoc sp. KVJ20]
MNYLHYSAKISILLVSFIALLQWKQYITIHGEGTAMLCPTIACSDNRYNFDQMKSKIENQKGNSEYGSDQLEK